MDEKVDLRDLLKSWPYDPDDDARIVTTRDGREVLQVRLPLGIEQYELRGRPDGLRPQGRESFLAYYLERLAQAQQEHTAADFALDPDQCAELFTEGTLYYFRYVHLFQIKNWMGTLQDTARNLQLFDLIHQYAKEEDDQNYLEQWRPYLLRMHAAAQAMLHLEQDDYANALETIRLARAQIEAMEELDDETFRFERDRSLRALSEMIDQIEETKPVSQLELLERELRQAIETQHFERAADLRDRIRTLRDELK